MGKRKRFIYKGKEERLPEIEAFLRKKRIDRKTMYTILKYYELNPENVWVLEQEFPDV